MPKVGRAAFRAEHAVSTLPSPLIEWTALIDSRRFLGRTAIMDRIQLRAMLAEIFTDVTGENLSSLRDEQNLKDDLQLDSLDLVSMAVGVQDHLGINIEAAEVTNIVTVGDLVGLLQAKLTPSKPASAA